KHDADAGQILAREAAMWLVGIDDDTRIRQTLARQMMVSDNNIDATSLGFGHAFDAGDAVIDGDDNIRSFFTYCEFDDFRCQAIAVFEAVGYDVIDLCSHRTQAAQPDCAGSGT